VNIHSLAADIADRIPEMAKDSKMNNTVIIENMIRDFRKVGEHSILPFVDWRVQSNSKNTLTGTAE